MPSSVRIFKGICNWVSSTRLISGNDGLRIKYAPSIKNTANKQQLILDQNRNLISFIIKIQTILSLKNTSFPLNETILFSKMLKSQR